MALGRNLYQELFGSGLSKSEQTKISIARVTVDILAKEGVEALNYQRIATEVGVTRQLVNQYFATKEELLLYAAIFTRARFQDFVLQRMPNSVEPVELLSGYIEACFEWIEEERNDAVFWLIVIFASCMIESIRTVIHELTAMGANRIAQMIELGNRFKLFDVEDSEASAKVIQSHIQGALLTVLTEKKTLKDKKSFKNAVKESCLQILKCKAERKS